MVTTENSIITAKTSTPLHKGNLFGILAHGGEINIDDKYGVRISKVNDNFVHIKIVMYGEKPTYKIHKDVKIKKVIEKEIIIKEKKIYVKEKKPDKEAYKMKVGKEVNLFD